MTNPERYSDESFIPTRWTVKWDEPDANGVTTTPRKITFTKADAAERTAKGLREMGLYPTIFES